ncbi:glutathione-independent formaldehyde dehydrogenase [Polyangium jinanense]|uniref:Glutathione-independent formaldehyde dehydrogenase n=1 Tax=Polyangium jinanense TaxID=2829994 RepID=A0A9X3XDP3_9BACT|nr:glutathione-independent formaldehyde dehydrogenase [Polyangium jinanense]MDC3956976.1 glutathione-independent formaldehyde dehydrogenase [Polyangium jinanense]MDC3987133.1 glutathione-independent formaldehyde dehydrogenase [Polyangium jinanense]
MRAVVYKGRLDVAVEEVPDARIEEPTDAIVQITSAAICGSDLHMYEGRTAAQPGTVLGHEPLGVVEEVGSAVERVKKGDRVVMPFNISCGTCFNCKRGYTAACLNVNPSAHGGAYGYVGMGPFRGGQAEHLRVPFADTNCLSLPGEPRDVFENDFVLLADVFPTGWFATDLAAVEPGMSVAVFGAGPVGLLSAYASSLRGADEIYVVDYVPDRLARAEAMGATAIDFMRGDPVEQIVALRKAQGIATAKMDGVMSGIEAVGFQAVDWTDPSHEAPNRIIEDLIRLVNPTGHIGIVGLYVPEDPGGKNPHAKKGELQISFGKLWEKGISFGTGQTPVMRYGSRLRDLVTSGRARPSQVVTHRMPLDAAPEAYAKLSRREDGFAKVVLDPHM